MSDACRLLHERLAQLTRLGADFSPSDVPLNGVYVMFERGERAHGTDRIVHVGTHSGGGNLRQRLSEHYRKTNKDRSIPRRQDGSHCSRHRRRKRSTPEHDLVLGNGKGLPNCHTVRRVIHSPNFDHLRVSIFPLTAIPTACFWPTRTTSFCPRVMPV